MWMFIPHFSLLMRVYREQKKVTRKGTEKSTRKP